MDTKAKKLRVSVAVSSIILWLAANLYYFWVKIVGAVFLLTGIIELVLFLIISIGSLSLFVGIIRFPSFRILENYLTICLSIFVIGSLYFGVFRFNENTFQSPVKIRACYEGTMNTSHLYFREDGTFEDFNIGFFAHVYYIKGTWTQAGDTLELDFEGEKPRLMGERLLIKENYLYSIEEDTLAPTFYYLGHCRGLN